MVWNVLKVSFPLAGIMTLQLYEAGYLQYDMSCATAVAAHPVGACMPDITGVYRL